MGDIVQKLRLFWKVVWVDPVKNSSWILVEISKENSWGLEQVKWFDRIRIILYCDICIPYFFYLCYLSFLQPISLSPLFYFIHLIYLCFFLSQIIFNQRVFYKSIFRNFKYYYSPLPLMCLDHLINNLHIFLAPTSFTLHGPSFFSHSNPSMSPLSSHFNH